MVMLAGLGASAIAESHARIVRLSDVDGNVQVDRGAGDGFDAAITNMPVVEGMQIWTNSGSRAEVEFENGSTVRLAGGAHLSFSRLSLADDGTKVTEMQTDGGTSYFDLKPGRYDAFTLDFAQSRVELRHSASFRLVMSSGEAELAVTHGSVEVTAGGDSLEVSKNHTANFDLENNQAKVEHGVEQNSFDDWNSQQRDYHDRYLQASFNGSGYGYGSSDLSYFGSFGGGGCGNMWRPNGVGLGWNPFSDGAWIFYPGFGFTWVSSAPWGWLPYRYGSWGFSSGCGWGWSPGGWNSWNSMPTMTSRPVIFKPPVAPVVPVRTGGGAGSGGGGVVIVTGGQIRSSGPVDVRRGIPVLAVRDDRWQRPVARVDGASAAVGPRSVVPTKSSSGFGGNSSGSTAPRSGATSGGRISGPVSSPSIQRSAPMPSSSPSPAPRSSPSPAPTRPH